MNENEIQSEEWRPICGYEGLYEVSSLGKVKSLKFGKEKILKFGKNKKGYFRVGLSKDKKREFCSVHRLVANAFIPNPNNLPTVNHIDENKENNVVDNLEWMNMKQQVNHGTCIQRRVASTDYKAIAAKIDYKARTAKIDYKAISEKQRNNPNKSKRVYQYSKDGELVAIWNSTQECGRQGYAQANVAACCRNCFNREGNNVYKGFIWSYQEIKKQES